MRTHPVTQTNNRPPKTHLFRRSPELDVGVSHGQWSGLDAAVDGVEFLEDDVTLVAGEVGRIVFDPQTLDLAKLIEQRPKLVIRERFR